MPKTNFNWLSWEELYDKYIDDIGLGKKKGIVATSEFENYVEARQWKGEKVGFWNPRGSTNATGKTRGRLSSAPYDDQWKKGYAFALVDGATFKFSKTQKKKKFVRQIPVPAKRKPTRDSDKEETKGPFPTCAFIFSDSRAINPWRWMAGKRESVNPNVGDVSPQEGEFLLEPCEVTGLDCNWEDDVNERVCKDCGSVIELFELPVDHDNPSGEKSSKDEQVKKEFVKLTSPKAGTYKGGDLSKENIVQRGSKLLSEIGPSLTPGLKNGIEGVMKGDCWFTITEYITQRIADGKMDSEENAWIVWRTIGSTPAYVLSHFAIAAWIWCLRKEGVLSNDILQEIHTKYRLLAGGNDWKPRDVLMVVEILRLIWWEREGGDFEWTPLPANIVS